VQHYSFEWNIVRTLARGRDTVLTAATVLTVATVARGCTPPVRRTWLKADRSMQFRGCYIPSQQSRRGTPVIGCDACHMRKRFWACCLVPVGNTHRAVRASGWRWWRRRPRWPRGRRLRPPEGHHRYFHANASRMPAIRPSKITMVTSRPRIALNCSSFIVRGAGPCRRPPSRRCAAGRISPFWPLIHMQERSYHAAGDTICGQQRRYRDDA
jgi:hypothetical protein